jgi:chromosome segregation ATPase
MEEDDSGETTRVDNKQNNDDEIAFLQTQKALMEAVKEQKILREKLTALEARNRPAKWGKPVVIQSIDTTRGRFENDADIAPEQLLSDLKTAQHMLENAKRVSETARAEKKHLDNEIAQLAISAREESESLLQANALHHKQYLQSEQQQFLDQVGGWQSQKSDIQTEAEYLAMVSHDVLHQSSESRVGVEQQRKKIASLATQLRTDTEKAKELKDELELAKSKVALIDNLAVELDANRKQAEDLQRSIVEQRQILRAVRISAEARRLVDDISSQTDELVRAKSDAEAQVEAVMKELDGLLKNEDQLKSELAQAQREFKSEQMALLVLEAELRELRAEFERVKVRAIEEGRRNVELQKSLREERMNATVRYIVTHSRDIHRVDRVQSTLLYVRGQLRTGEFSSLPALRLEKRSKSAAGSGGPPTPSDT